MWTGCLLVALVVTLAQVVAPTLKYPTAEWDQDADTLAEAQSYVYRYYLDGATVGAAFTGVTCSGTAKPYTCRAALPVTAIGPHTVAMTAEIVSGGVSSVSVKSNVAAFDVVSDRPGAPVSVGLVGK